MNAKLITTDFQNGQHWDVREVAPGEIDHIHRVSVYPKLERQTFQGFGGAFTEAAAYCYQKLPAEKRREFMECYFGKSGLGYTLGRTHIGSCDFSLGHYSCREQEAAGFDASRDEAYIIPMIRDAEAAAGQPISLLLSPWSPPAFMKSNRDRNHGGKLLPEYWALWGQYMAEYVRYYRDRGLTVRHISVQNEPAATQTWDSCIYTAQEEGRFAVESLKPALEKAGCGDVKILIWDHNKEILPYRAADSMAVPGAETAIDGFAAHWYTGDHFDALRLTVEQFPGKELWFTEGCVEYGRFNDSTSIQKAEMYAHDIIGNLSGGISGSIDWNLLLDAEGGPNHVGNFCEAPIMLTEDGQNFEIRGEYAYIGQFSRYIRPGAVAVGSSVYSSGVEATAFRNPDGTFAVVTLNRTERSQRVCVSTGEETGYNYTLSPHSIATLVW